MASDPVFTLRSGTSHAHNAQHRPGSWSEPTASAAGGIVLMGSEVRIERGDSMEEPPRGCHRLSPPRTDAVRAKGVLTWVAAHDARRAEVRLYDRLFTEAEPDAAGRDFEDCLTPDNKKVVSAWLEPSLAGTDADETFQFERHGCFVADRRDHSAAAPVFNRITPLKDGWAK